eukprot:6295304-Pyramimonas_sp.AAC.1
MCRINGTAQAERSLNPGPVGPRHGYCSPAKFSWRENPRAQAGPGVPAAPDHLPRRCSGGRACGGRGPAADRLRGGGPLEGA